MNLRLVATTYVCFICLQSIAVDSATGDSHPESRPLSLIELAPSLFTGAKRYPTFYGDASTATGGLSERSHLLGDVGGYRDTLVESGIYVDAGSTQFFQGNVSGGERQSPDPRSNGSTDLWFWLDTGKANWWSGGAVFAHYEANWSTSMNADVGALSPANFDATMPRANNPPSAKLSELIYLQALPNHFIASLGKQDMAAWADNNFFANNERTQFTYLGLVNNPMAGVFFPYTGIGAWLDWVPSHKHNLVWVWSQSDSKAGQTGFDNLFNDDNAYAFQYVFSPNIANRPGNFLVAALYSTKDVESFAISRQRLLAELAGDLPVVEKSENYAVIVNVGQYLWAEQESASAFSARPRASRARHHAEPVGVGIFARGGWAPEDRNTIDQFYSLGIGGYGVLIPGRNDDNWGVGWAGSHISDDLRELVDTKRTWEHAFEVFYNFAVTPATNISLDGQRIRPANKSADTAYTLGVRLQLDF